MRLNRIYLIDRLIKIFYTCIPVFQLINSILNPRICNASRRGNMGLILELSNVLSRDTSRNPRCLPIAMNWVTRRSICVCFVCHYVLLLSFRSVFQYLLHRFLRNGTTLDTKVKGSPQCTCMEIICIHIWQILPKIWFLTRFTQLSLSFLLHRCMSLNETFLICCTTNAWLMCMWGGDNSCSTNFARVKVLDA